MIDKKGRIFGKINIIDLIVVVIVVCILGGLGYKLFGPNSNDQLEQEQQKGTVYVTFKVTRVMAESANFVEVGDKLVIADEESEAEIVNVSFEDTKEVGFTDEGKLVIEDNPLYVDGYIQVKAQGIKTNEGIEIEDNYVRVNANFELATQRFSAGSKVVDIEFEAEK